MLTSSEATTEREQDRSHAYDAPLEVLEPLIVLPSQHDGSRSLELSGERRLMAAVLADAIRLYLKHRSSRTACGQILFRETERWIESADRRWLLSFENVCETLGIDDARLRGALHTHAASIAGPSIAFDAGRLRVSRGRKIRI